MQLEGGSVFSQLYPVVEGLGGAILELAGCIPGGLALALHGWHSMEDEPEPGHSGSSAQ